MYIEYHDGDMGMVIKKIKFLCIDFAIENIEDWANVTYFRLYDDKDSREDGDGMGHYATKGEAVEEYENIIKAIEEGKKIYRIKLDWDKFIKSLKCNLY